MFGYDTRANPPGYIARCACGWKSGSEATTTVAMTVLRWHLDGASPTQTAVNRLGLVLVRQFGGKAIHAAKWLETATICGRNLRRFHSQTGEEITCEECLKVLAERTESKV